MADDETTLEVKGLERLLKAIKARPPVARIGILGTNNMRAGGGSSNAEIGAAHEFGTDKLPQRSFLRVPLSENLTKKIESSGALDKDTMNEVIKTKSVVPWLKKIMALAESIVAEAFATGGFGKWPPSDMTHKTNQQTLVETTQLRDSITSEVKASGE